MDKEKQQFNKAVDDRIIKFLQGGGFTKKQIIDTPIDDLAVVPRKYVNMYGSIAGRPQVSVVGQQYFSTTDGYPIFRNSNNAWVSATGSVVG